MYSKRISSLSANINGYAPSNETQINRMLKKVRQTTKSQGEFTHIIPWVPWHPPQPDFHRLDNGGLAAQNQAQQNQRFCWATKVLIYAAAGGLVSSMGSGS
ncbi:MAG: hypothetical protein PHZ03_06670 [Syntrophomonas sp.]|nr:hypothetical protein [Syntrophomonas sp.]